MKDLLSSTDVKLDLYLVTFLGPIAGYFGAFGSLCAIADWFTIWWFIFGLFLVFPISTAIGFALFVLIPIDSSPEGKKAAAKIAVESIFQWLCYDFCYLAIFNHWLIPTFILGIIFVVLMFIEIINTFLFNAKKSVILFICELLVGIGLYKAGKRLNLEHSAPLSPQRVINTLSIFFSLQICIAGSIVFNEYSLWGAKPTQDHAPPANHTGLSVSCLCASTIAE